MRITRNKIRRLIRESILKEQNISTNPIGTFTARKIQNQSKQQPPPSTGDSLAAAATAAANNNNQGGGGGDGHNQLHKEPQ